MDQVFRQTRIFSKPPYSSGMDENWAETLLGCVVKPIVDRSTELNWFWFSRYVTDDGDDCDLSELPKDFLHDRYHWSLRFRYCMRPDNVGQFEDMAQEIVDRAGYVVTDWRGYDMYADLGGPRTLGEDMSTERRKERGNLVANFYHATSKLCLHGLIGPDSNGNFRIEKNTVNPCGSPFETTRHVFCNITNCVTPIRVSDHGKTIMVAMREHAILDVDALRQQL